MRCLDSITESIDMNLSKLQKIMEDRGACLAAVHGGHKESDSTTTKETHRYSKPPVKFGERTWDCSPGHAGPLAVVLPPPAAYQAPPSMGFSRQGYWSGVPLPSLWAHSLVSCDPQKSPDTPEKALAPHSSTLAWKIPWTEEPGALQSMGSLRVGHTE